MNDVPPFLETVVDPIWILTVFSSIALLSALYAVWWSVRERDPIPVAACIGAFICSLNEPFYDVLGKIVYAGNHAVAYTGFERDIPWFLVLGYIPWVGLIPCFVARLMCKGAGPRTFYLLAIGSFLSVVVVETLGTALDGWAYYGQAPLKFLVVAPQLAPVPIVGGLLIFALAYPLQGWLRGVAALVVSTVALPMVFAGASWPLYVGLNFELPVWVDWILAVAMLVLTAGFVVAAVTIGSAVRKSALIGPGISDSGPATEAARRAN